MNELSIRQAAFEDAKLLTVLASVTFYEAYFETDEPQDISNYILRAYSLEQIKSELTDENSTFFIAETNGKAVGFAKLRENSRPECLQRENTVELHRIYLVERVWRKGIGRALIERCLAEAKRKGYQSLWLGTWERNIKAQAFYTNLGFSKAGEFRHDYESIVSTNFVFVKKV